MTQHPAPLIHPHADPFLTGPMPDPDDPNIWSSLSLWEVLEAARQAGRLIDANGVVPPDPRFVDSPCGPVLAPGQTHPEEP